MTTPSISAVIFDVDGILVNTVPFHFRAWKQAFGEEGIPFEKEYYQRINGIPRDTGVALILKDDATPERIRDIGERKQNYYLELIEKKPPQPLAGITSLLREIRNAGWRMAAASSSKNALTVLTAAKIREHFDVIVTGNDFRHPKPHPDIFLTAAHLLKAEPAVTAVVEDAANGVRAARAGGFRCIAVANSEPSDTLRTAGASIVVPTTKDLTMDLFDGLAQV